MSFKIDFDGNALLKAQEMLKNIPGGMQTATARAINRALQGARAAAVKAIRERYTVRATDIRETLKIKKATKSDLEGSLTSRGTKLDINASHFKVRPRTDTTGNRQRKVVAEIVKGSPFEVQRGFIYNSQVFRREGRTRLPIAKQVGPAVPQMLEQDDVLQRTTEVISERFRERLEHETEVLLNDLTGK